MVKKKILEWMFVVVLNEWKWVGIVLGAWNLKEISQILSSLVAQLFTDLITKLGI